MQELTTVTNNNQLIVTSLNSNLFTQWINYIDAKPKTISTYTRAIKQFYLYLQANGIIKPTRADIIAYREQLKADHKPTTIQAYLMAVKQFFQWAEIEGLYPNIANHIKGAKLDNEHKKDYLTPSQAATLLSNIDRTTLQGKRDYAILSLMVTTGLRTISIILANIEDIRTAAESPALYYQGKGHEEKADYVKLAPQVDKAIREYLTARGQASDNEPLFISIANRNNGNRLTTRSISRLVKEHLIKAGYNSNRLTAHSLRHTAATLNLLAGGTVEETQQLLGHTNINTTLIYSHALERAKNNSENRIANTIFNN